MHKYPCMWMHTPADIQMESRKHTFAGYVHRCTRSRATWICIPFALRRKYTAIRMEDTYCIAHRHTFTQPALPVTDVGRNIASKKALSFLFILSVFWHAYLCTHSVAMSLKLFLFLFQFLCAHFFSLLFPSLALSSMLSSWIWSHLCQERLEEKRTKRGGH